MISLRVFTIPSKLTTDSPHLFPSIHFDVSPLSRMHSSGTARRLMQARRSAKAICFEDRSRSRSEKGIILAGASKEVALTVLARLGL
jgi:hypothetical protein